MDKSPQMYENRTTLEGLSMSGKKYEEVSRSGCYDFALRLGRPENGADLTGIIAEQREHSFRTYGYRKIWLALKKLGIR